MHLHVRSQALGPAPWTEIVAALIKKTRADMAIGIMETFGVPSGTRADFVTGPFTFGGHSNVPRDGQWVRYLTGRDQPDKNGVPTFKLTEDFTPTISGVGLAEPERLILPIFSLANAIPLLTANSGRPYSARNMLHWRLCVAALLSRLPTSAKVELQIESVPIEIPEKMRFKFLIWELT